MKASQLITALSLLVIAHNNSFAAIELINNYFHHNPIKHPKTIPTAKEATIKPYVVGGTYDSMSQQATEAVTCLNAGNNVNNLTLLNPQAILNFSQEQTLQSVQQALGINITATVGFGPFAVSAAYNYGKTSQNDAYTLNLNYVYQYSGIATFKNDVLVQGLDALTPSAREIVNSSPTAFRQMCGDNFVSALEAGASVLMRVTLKFNSTVEKNYYEEGLKDIGGLQGILSTISQNPHGMSYSLTAEGIQVGGNPALFKQLFTQYGGKTNADGYLTLECGTNGNLNPNCTHLINDVISYATGIGKQLQTPSDYYVSNPVLAKWSNIGIHPGDVGINPEITNAMQQLTQQYYADYDSLQFISDYQRMLASKQRLSSSMQAQLIELQNKYQTVMSMYSNPDYHLQDCFNGFVSTRCLVIRDNVLSTRTQILAAANLNDLLNYLKNNQYSVTLAINPDLTNRAQCLLSPITDANTHLFMLNCNGQASGTFDANTGISLTKIADNTKMQVTNLNLQYVNAAQITNFTYQFEQPLHLDSFYNNVYSGIALTHSHTSGHDFSANTNLTFTNLH